MRCRTSTNRCSAALFTSSTDKRSSAEQNVIVTKCDALIVELQTADIVVIGAPMYNFGILSQLKTYFDWITHAGVTFRYTENGPEALIKGKKVYIVTARGGKYAAQVRQTTARRHTCARFLVSST